jgi:hypothetical protein
MSETLYPHEVIIKCWDKNLYRIISTVFFIYAGIVLTLVLNTYDIFDFCVMIMFLVCGIIYSKYDYESRGIK